jgi:hypothetical protein
VGRAPGNDLVLVDAKVPAHHAALWTQHGVVWIEDLGSTNGTWLRGERLTGPAALADGDEVGLGTDLALRLSGEPEAAAAALLVEDRTAGVRVAVVGDRFRIGPGPGSDLRIAGAPEGGAVLLLYDEGEVWLGVDGEDRPLGVGSDFELFGHVLCLVRDEGPPPRTAVTGGDLPGYHLAAALDGPVGPEATLRDPASGRKYRVESDNRAVLLYLLACRVRDDAGLPARDRGWCGDDEVMAGVWGRARPADDNALNVLVHRLRREILAAGFDPWFIEKRRRRLRARVASVAVP